MVLLGPLSDVKTVELFGHTRVHSDLGVKVLLCHSKLHAECQTTNGFFGGRPEVVDANDTLCILSQGNHLDIGGLSVGFGETKLKRHRLAMVHLNIVFSILQYRFLFSHADTRVFSR